MHRRIEKYTLSIVVPYIFISIPFLLSFTTWLPFGFTGYEISKTILLPLLIGLGLIFILLSKIKLVFPNRKIILLFFLWIAWNTVSSFINKTLATSLSGEIYYQFGLWQLFYLFLYSFGNKQMATNYSRSFFPILAVLTGCIHSFIAILQHTPTIIRSSGLLGEPNWLGGILMVCAVSTAALLVNKEWKQYRLQLLGALVLILTGLFATHSRSAMIGTATSCILVLFFSKRSSIVSISFTLPIIMFILLMGIGIQADTLAPILERTTIRGFTGTESRIWIYEKGIQLFLEKPITGWGWEQVGAAFQTHPPQTRLGMEHMVIPRSHNLFLDLLITGGIPSLLLFGSLQLSLMSASWKRFTTSQHVSDLLGIILPCSLLIYGQFNPLSLVHWTLLF